MAEIARMRQLFSIGHSTHAFDRFLALLAQHDIELLADIRRFPGSKKFPHFNREALAAALPPAGVGYRWFEPLGGRRHASGGSSKNLGLRNASFRHYADYMATAEFRTAAEQLLEAAERQRVAMMCAESLFWRCHRRLVSDFLLLRAVTVQHIMPSGELRPHTLTPGAVIENQELIYPPPDSHQAQLLFD
jgi:uncharacterized protein (DUF488 family)